MLYLIQLADNYNWTIIVDTRIVALLKVKYIMCLTQLNLDFCEYQISFIFCSSLASVELSFNIDIK